MDPKSSPRSGSQKVRFCNYLLHLSKVRRLRNGPHFGRCLGASFVQKSQFWLQKRVQIIVQKKSATPLRKQPPIIGYDHGPGLPDSLPRVRGFLNKKQLSEQETTTAVHFWVNFWALFWNGFCLSKKQQQLLISESISELCSGMGSFWVNFWKEKCLFFDEAET